MKNNQKNTGLVSCQSKSFIWKAVALVFSVIAMACMCLAFTVKPVSANAEGENVTITFVTDGTEASPIELPADSDISTLEPTSEKTGYSLVGWTTTQDGTELYVFDKMPAENLTLYAKWDLNVDINGVEGYVGEFDNQEHLISVDASSDLVDAEISYQWYFKSLEDGLVEGATQNTLAVKNVLDSGKYMCKVTVTADGQTKSEYTEQITVTISPKVVDIIWNNRTYLYTGGNHAPAVTAYYNDFDNKKVWLQTSVEGGDFTNYKADGYVFNALEVTDEPNYTLPTDASKVYYITKADHDISQLVFADKTVVYDGQPHSILAEGVPSGVTVEYSNNNSQINHTPMPETITARFIVDDNHNPIPEMTANLMVRKAAFNINYVRMNNKTVIENGQLHKIELTGELPSNFTVTYEGESQMKAGVYAFTAHFTSDGNYYDLPSLTGLLTIKRPTLYGALMPNNKPFAILDAEAGFNPNLTVDITSKDAETYTNANLKLEDNQKIGAIYDISMLEDGNPMSFYGWVNVKVIMPEAMNNREFKIYHDHNGTITEVDYKLVDGYVEFRVLEFSDFIFVYSDVDLLWIVIALGAILGAELIAIIALIISLKAGKGKKNGKGASSKTVTAASASPLSLLIGVPFMPTGAVGLIVFLSIAILGSSLVLIALSKLKYQQNKRKKEGLVLETNVQTKKAVSENDVQEQTNEQPDQENVQTEQDDVKAEQSDTQVQE